MLTGMAGGSTSIASLGFPPRGQSHPSECLATGGEVARAVGEIGPIAEHLAKTVASVARATIAFAKSPAGRSPRLTGFPTLPRKVAKRGTLRGLACVRRNADPRAGVKHCTPDAAHLLACCFEPVQVSSSLKRTGIIARISMALSALLLTAERR
jgi:hypothetical protein